MPREQEPSGGRATGQMKAGKSLRSECGAHARLQPAQHPPDRSLAGAQFLGDLGLGPPPEAQVEDQALLSGEALKLLLEDLFERQQLFGGAAGGGEPLVGQRTFPIHASLEALVEAAPVDDLVQGHGTEQAPEGVPVRQLVGAALRASQEGAADGLHHGFRGHARHDCRVDAPRGNPLQGGTIARHELREDGAVAVAEAGDQPLGIGDGFLHEGMLPPWLDLPRYHASRMDGIDEQRRQAFEVHRRAGGQERLDTFLPDPTLPSYRPTLEELLLIDFEFRWKAWCKVPEGPRPSLRDEQAHFPMLDEATWTRLEEACAWLGAHYDRAPEGDARVGRYHLGARIGEGVSAVVYRAEDPDLGRPVALKLTRRSFARDPERRERVRREALGAAGLRHPGVVTIHEVGMHGERPYFVLELVEGVALEQRLREGPVGHTAAARLVAQVADAVDYAHEMGVIHRDIKPGNILLDADGRPRLTDFGLAQLASTEELTRHGDVLGTPAYMAPEQARGESVDHRVDVYALGVLLYELLTGSRPFGGPTSEATLYAVVHDLPAPPSTLDPAIADDLEVICRTAMAKEPDRRYETAGALASDLRRYLEHRPIEARRAGWASRAMLWRRRNPALALSLVGGLLAVLVVGGIGLANVLHERARFRRQRDVAQANLVDSLLGQAGALIEAGGANWRPRALALVGRAAERMDREEDRLEARTLLARCEVPSGLIIEEEVYWAPRPSVPRLLVGRPDGQDLAVVTEANELWTRGVHADAPHRVTPLGDIRATAACWAPSAGLLLGFEDGRVEVREPSTHVAIRLREPGAAPVEAFASHAGSGLLAIGGRNGWLGVYRLAPRFERLAEFPGHGGAVTALGFSSDGEQLVSAGEDLAVRFWRWRTRTAVGSIREHDVVRHVTARGPGEAFSATNEQYGFRLLDAQRQATIPAVWQDDHPSGPVSSLSKMPGGGIVTTSEDGTISIWRVDRRHGVSTMAHAAHGEGGHGPIVAGALLAGGVRLAAAHEDGSVSVWNLEAEGAAHRYETHQAAVFAPAGHRLIATGSVLPLAGDAPEAPAPFVFDPVVAIEPAGTGRWLVAYRGGRVLLRDADTAGDRMIDTGCAGAAALCVGEGRLALGDKDGQVWLGPTDGGEGAIRLDGGVGAVVALESLPAERGVLIIGRDGVARVTWEGTVEMLDPTPRAGGAAARRNGMLAVTGADGSIEIRDARTLAVQRVLRGHTRAPSALTFLPDDGPRLLSVDRTGATRLWDVRTGTEEWVRQVEGAPGWCAVGRDGGYACVGTTLVDLDSGAIFARILVDTHGGGTVSDDGILLAAARGGVWEVAESAIAEARADMRAQLAQGLDAGTRILPPARVWLAGGHAHRIWGVDASPDDRWVATSGHAGDVVLWDAESLRFERQVEGPGAVAWTVAFAPDARLAYGRGAMVHVCEPGAEQGARRLAGHEGLVTSIRFSPRELLMVTTANDRTLRLWDSARLVALGQLDTGGLLLHDTRFRPDGQRLAAAAHDGSVLLWDAAPGALVDGARPLRRFSHGAPVWSVAFDPDGRLLASGSEDGQIQIRDAESGRLHLALRSGPRLRMLTFSPDGRYLAASCWATSSTLWDLRALRARLASYGLDWQ